MSKWGMQNFKIEILENKAKALLINQELITQELLEWAYSEALEFSHDHNAPAYALYDFALARLKRLLKIPFSDEDALIYQNAIKAIQSSLKIEPLKAKSSQVRGRGFLL